MRVFISLAAVFLHLTSRIGMHTFAQNVEGIASPQNSHNKAEWFRTTEGMNSTLAQSCRAYDGDRCGCATQEHCEFDISSGNLCSLSSKSCHVNNLWPHECRRRNAFYIVGGKVCYNAVSSGDCVRDFSSKSNFAINLNGEPHVDKNGITYFAHNSTEPLYPTQQMIYKNASHYGTSVCKKKGRGDEVDIKNGMENLSDNDIEALLWTYVEGVPPARLMDSKHNCFAFATTFLEDGVYEFNIKAVEMEYSKSGVRQFDIKLNGIVILPNVDLYRLIRMECVGIDLILNFYVGGKQKMIVLNGNDPMLLNNSTVTIELCNSRCSTVAEPVFIANAVSITRLHGGGPFCG